MMDALWQDLRYAGRSLLRSPGFTLVAVLTLALGIGANTAVFSAVNALLLRPLAVHQPDRLVELEWVRGNELPSASFTYSLYTELRDGAGVLSALAAYSFDDYSIRTGELAEPVMGYTVSGNYWSALGVRPAAGRFFGPAEDEPGKPSMVAVLSYRAWQERYEGDPGVIGKQLRLNGQSITVIGIAPEEFKGTVVGFSPELWVPLTATPILRGIPELLDLARVGDLFLVGRLAPGMSRERAQAAFSVRARQLAAEPTEGNPPPPDIRVHAASGLPREGRTPILGFLAMLLATAALVLAIASVNVAGMLLARGTARGKETAIRLAMGAGRGRLVRQLVTESMLLWTLGGMAGVLVSVWITDLLLRAELPIPARIELDLGVDLRVLGFALLLSALTAVLFGLAPALRATRIDLVPALKDANARGRDRSRLRNILVVGQIALSLLLLVGAGLFARALQHAWTLDPGFAVDGAVIASFDFSLNGYNSGRGEELLRELRQRLVVAPGIEATTVASAVPLGTVYRFDHVEIPGHRNTPERAAFDVDLNSISPDYFKTMRIPLLQGRRFTDADRSGAAPVAIINETMARRFWPAGDAVGAHIRRNDTMLEIVGVARDVRNHGLGKEPNLYLYTPFAQNPQNPLTLVLRTPGDERTALTRLRRELRALDPDAPLMISAPLREWIGVKLVPQRIAATLTGAFGLVGLLLAAVGLYGTIAYSVGQRTREIGVRMALGAQTGDVLRLVLRRGVVLTGIGLALGLLLSLGFTRFVSGLLVGVSPTDPATFAGVVLLLASVALLASYLPARRAVRVDPMIALRSE